ncbi:MAG TPA: hypothetical protein VMH81_19020 [Bryobacteraceae bacterium]|nr:hypothetical protein [Bryobacteraceae bacterium]
MARETRWDLALALAGLVYLALVLFMGIEVPVVGVALVVLAVCALIRPHRHSRHERQDKLTGPGQ